MLLSAVNKNIAVNLLLLSKVEQSFKLLLNTLKIF